MPSVTCWTVDTEVRELFVCQAKRFVVFRYTPRIDTIFQTVTIQVLNSSLRDRHAIRDTFLVDDEEKRLDRVVLRSLVSIIHNQSRKYSELPGTLYNSVIEMSEGHAVRIVRNVPMLSS